MNQNKQIQHSMSQQAAGNPLIAFFFGYSTRVLAVAAAGTGQGTVNITADSAFMLQNLMAFAVSAGAVVATPIALVQVTDTSSGATIFDQAQPISSVFGTAQNPFIMPVPRIFPANSLIQVNVTNNGAAATDFYFTFGGRKLYRKGVEGVGL